jgi:hypothetical protein
VSRTVLRETQGEIPWVYSPKLSFLFGFILSWAIEIMKAFQPQTNPKYQFPGPIDNSLALFKTPNHTL